jgi:hypothetical protein
MTKRRITTAPLPRPIPLSSKIISKALYYLVNLQRCALHEQQDVSNETLSITAWEKSHPTEVAACDKESGWK